MSIQDLIQERPVQGRQLEQSGARIGPPMAVQRFLPDVERTRRGAGWVFVAIALALLSGVGWLLARAGRVNGTGMVFLAVPLGLLALGLYLALRRKEVLAIDLDNRKYAVIRNGAQSASGALDSLGPLAVERRSRQTGNSDQRRTIIQYVVRAAQQSQLDLYVMTTPGQARQKMEALARAWRVSCQAYGGAVRGADDLDVPLHQRLRGDREARVIAPLRSEWGIQIEPLSEGYAIVSTHRSWSPLLRGSGILLFVLFAAFGYSPGRLSSLLPEMAGDLLSKVLAGLMGVVALVGLWVLGRAARDSFYPGTVRVTEAGVSYRGSRMAFSEIEEVTATLPIELVGDRRILRLAETFCPPAALSAVAHEIQRLVLEVGERSGVQ